MVAIYSRQALYELVWSKPRSLLAKDLGISDVAIAKTCRRVGIPMPPVGWWNKLAAGKKAVRIPLPRRGLGRSDEVVVGAGPYGYYTHHVEFDLDAPPPPAPVFEESMDAVKARAAEMIRRVPATRDLTSAHHTIAPLLAKDEQRRKAAIGQTWVWDKPLFDSPLARRRLRIANAIFKALDEASCEGAISDKTANEWSVRVGDERFTVTLQETKSKTKDAPTLLVLSIPCLAAESGMQAEWRDSAEQKLESSLKAITSAILIAGELTYRRGILQRHQWRLERRTERIEEARQAKLKAEREERERLRKAEQARRDKLLGLIAERRQAEDIRAFVEAMAEHDDIAADTNGPERYAAWRVWALGVAERLDPLTRPAAQVMGIDDGGDRKSPSIPL